MNGEGSDVVGVAVQIEAAVALENAGAPPVELGAATPIDDEDPRRYEEQTAPGPSRRMMASVCKSSVGHEGRLSLSLSACMRDRLIR